MRDENTDHECENQKDRLEENQQEDDLFSKTLDGGKGRPIGVPRNVTDEKFEEVINDHRVNEAQREQPRTDEKSEAQLKWTVDQEDTAPVLLHPLIVRA